MFLQNAWYVAAWDREIDRTLAAFEVSGDDLGCRELLGQ